MLRHSAFMCCLLTCLAAGLLPAGCAGVSDTSKARQSAAVERVNESPLMSPADRDRNLQRAHTLGLQLAEQGRYGDALAAFEEALALRPGSTDILFNIAACHDAMGDPMQAVLLYRQILDVTPDDPDCYANLGTSYIKMYHREKSPVWRKMARKAWTRSVELRADQPDVKAFLAQTDTVD